MMALKLSPTLFFVVWQISFIVIGLSFLVEDNSLKHQKLCQDFYIWRNVCFNVVLSFLVFVSYFLTSPGEGARVRALTCLVLHFGFASWGVLTWTAMSKECQQILEAQYKSLFDFFRMSIVYNILFFSLFLFHEVYFGNKFQLDVTIMADIAFQGESYAEFPRFPDNTQPPKEGQAKDGSAPTTWLPHAPSASSQEQNFEQKPSPAQPGTAPAVPTSLNLNSEFQENTNWKSTSARKSVMIDVAASRRTSAEYGSTAFQMVLRGTMNVLFMCPVPRQGTIPSASQWSSSNLRKPGVDSACAMQSTAICLWVVV